MSLLVVPMIALLFALLIALSRLFLFPASLGLWSPILPFQKTATRLGRSDGADASDCVRNPRSLFFFAYPILSKKKKTGLAAALWVVGAVCGDARKKSTVPVVRFWTA